VYFFVGFAGQTVGLRFTTVARSSFITYMLALFVPPLQLMLSRKRLSAANLAGLAVVIVGIFVLTSPGGVGLNVGDGLTLLCALGFAVHIVLLDRLSGEHDPVALTLVQFAVTAALAAVGSVALEQPHLVPHFELWLALGYLSLFGSGLAVYLQIRFQRDTSPTRAVIIYSLEPVFSVLLAWSVLAERLGWQELFGGGLILAGVTLSEIWGTVQLEERARRR
jgi:drug/metabolite transporter (DMT)-like permease